LGAVKPMIGNYFPFFTPLESARRKLATARRELLLATRVAGHQRARMVADESGGAGNEQAQDNGEP
jgi:hypothetical protein